MIISFSIIPLIVLNGWLMIERNNEVYGDFISILFMEADCEELIKAKNFQTELDKDNMFPSYPAHEAIDELIDEKGCTI